MKVWGIVLIILAIILFIAFLFIVVAVAIRSWQELSNEDKEKIAQQLYENSMHNGPYDF